MAEKMVIVPQSLLDEIEESRKKIYKMHGNDIETIGTATLSKLVNITEPMWRVANTRWKEVK